MSSKSKKQSFLTNKNLYQVFCRNYGTDDSGPGTFDDITNRLEEIKNQGFDHIWLMGIFKIGDTTFGGTQGSPYAIMDYYSVDPRLGTLTDLEHLIKRAHFLEMKVLIDAVFNHTSKDHPWIQQHPAYYLPPIPKAQITRDYWENYSHLYNSDGTRILKNQQFEGRRSDDPFENQLVEDGHDDLCCQWTDTSQLNLANPELRKELINILTYWVDRGIDGFRCDMAMLLLNEVVRKQLGKYANYLKIPDTEFWQTAITEVNVHARKTRGSATEIAFIGEAYRYLSSLFKYGFTSIYHHDLYNVLKDVVKYNQPVLKLRQKLLSLYQEQTIQRPGWTIYLMNHDEEAAILEFGKNYVCALLMLIHLPVTFMVYNGEEFGNPISRSIQYVNYLMKHRDQPELIPIYTVKNKDLPLNEIYAQFLKLQHKTTANSVEFQLLENQNPDSPILGYAHRVSDKKTGLDREFYLFFNFNNNASESKDWDQFLVPPEWKSPKDGHLQDVWQNSQGIVETYPVQDSKLTIGLKPGDFHFFEFIH